MTLFSETLLQTETYLTSNPAVELTVVFRYNPAESMQIDKPPLDAEIEFYSINYDGVDIYSSLKEEDLEDLEQKCFKHIEDLKLEKEMHNDSTS